MSSSEYCPHCGAPLRPHVPCQYCAYITSDNGAGATAIPQAYDRQPIEKDDTDHHLFITTPIAAVYCVLGVIQLFFIHDTQVSFSLNMIILVLATINCIIYAAKGNVFLAFLNGLIVLLRVIHFWLLS